jgi:effector-binding domain-containing protein
MKIEIFGRSLLVISLLFLNSISEASVTEESKMQYEIETQTVAEQATLVMKFKVKPGELGKVLSIALPKVFGYISEKKGKPSGQPFARFLRKIGNIDDIEVGLPVAHALAGEGEIGEGKISSAKVAVTSHFGTYETVWHAHQAVQDWLAKKEKIQAGAAWEVYVSDPTLTPPEKVETRVFFPYQ